MKEKLLFTLYVKAHLHLIKWSGPGCGACNATGHQEAITVIWLSIWGGHVSHLGVELMWKEDNYPALSFTSWLPFASVALSPLTWLHSYYGWGRQSGHTECIFGLVLIGGVEQSAAKEALKWRWNIASMFWLKLCHKWIKFSFQAAKALFWYLQPKKLEFSDWQWFNLSSFRTPGQIYTPAAGSAATGQKSPAKTVQAGHKMPSNFQELSGRGRKKVIRHQWDFFCFSHSRKF